MAGSCLAQEDVWREEMRAGAALRSAGRNAEAKDRFQAAVNAALCLVPQDQRQAVARIRLADACNALAEYAEAERWYREAIAIIERQRPDSSELAGPLDGLGTVYREQHQLAMARDAYSRALMLLDKAQPANPALLISVLANSGAVESMRGNRSEAEQLLRRSIELAEQSPGQYAGQLVQALNNLAVLRTRAGESREAAAILRRACSVLEGADGAARAHLFYVLANLGIAEASSGRHAEALVEFEQARAEAEKCLGRGHPAVGEVLVYEARSLRKLNRKRDASEFEARAKAIAETAAQHSNTRHVVDARDLSP